MRHLSNIFICCPVFIYHWICMAPVLPLLCRVWVPGIVWPAASPVVSPLRDTWGVFRGDTHSTARDPGRWWRRRAERWTCLVRACRVSITLIPCSFRGCRSRQTMAHTLSCHWMWLSPIACVTRRRGVEVGGSGAGFGLGVEWHVCPVTDGFWGAGVISPTSSRGSSHLRK